MQIKPHQIPHFARQRERLAEIRNSWNAQPKEEGSYFSSRFIGATYIGWLLNGIGTEDNVKGINVEVSAKNLFDTILKQFIKK